MITVNVKTLLPSSAEQSALIVPYHLTFPQIPVIKTFEKMIPVRLTTVYAQVSKCTQNYEKINVFAIIEHYDAALVYV